MAGTRKRRPSKTRARATSRSKRSVRKKQAAGGDRAALARRIAAAKKLEALDAGGAKRPARGARPRRAPALEAAPTRALTPQRNSDFPGTYISEIAVSLDDPDHWMTVTWTGPRAASQETGPFRTSPGAGVTGINCDLAATSRRSGTKCTPKGAHYVEGFQSRLASDARATYVTWFMRRRGIALHYFPSVPRYAASHGCVRIESRRVAQLIQGNARIGLTRVVVGGAWTKPPRQW